MAQEIYTRTNQKIFFAGIALDNWRSAEVGQAFNLQAQVQAAREAALFHLYGAVLSLCHEVAQYYKLEPAAAKLVEVYLDQKLQRVIPTPELAELNEMARQPQSWLSSLLTAYAELFQPPQVPKAAKVDPSLPLISAVNLVDSPAPVTLNELEEWRKDLKALVLRYRQSLTEI